MCHKLSKIFVSTLFVLIIAVSFAIAGTPGTVISVDEQGMATVQTDDGQMLRVKVAGAQIGDKVDCTEKAGKASCKKAS
ncbi:MAG: hypothetical protein ETSY1_01460 [Candidatus Entotheonella factor]|uniref:DUF5666 domain-containing protein n=1 Tax=Entotheonella factor TaxID=1429438 RepID=W4LYQ8_ENTF1|nr:MAG: hypothetical protein ETSY1_01460 [Candidatus Entotheonella factor]